MLVIHRDQMSVFHNATRNAFEYEMLAHLRDFSPNLFAATGEEQMHQAVQVGIDAAAAHGLTFRGPVRLYLELQLLFGSQFDTDPQYPWAAEILRSQEVQMQRAELLYRKTLDFRQRVVGPKDVHAMAAYERLAQRARQPVTIPMAELAPALLRELKDIYPEKAAYVGDAGIGALVGRGIEEADRHGFSTVRGIGIVVSLMLFFGHGCMDDPIYPWIARTLKKETVADPEERAGLLERRAMTWLDQVVASL
jgi:hypothetical protein